MDELLKEIEEQAEAYAKQEGAELAYKFDEQGPTLALEMATDNKMAGVYYGPEDFAAGGVTAEAVLAFLQNTWEEA